MGKLRMGKYLLMILVFICVNASGNAQPGNPWVHIDTSIARKKNLSEISDLLIKLRNEAITQKRPFAIARAYYYQVRIADLRTEDSLYFRNSAPLDSILLTGNGGPELQMSVHLLLARRLLGFVSRSLTYNRKAYEDSRVPVNYAEFKNHQLDSIAVTHFEKAATLAATIRLAEVADYLWLANDPYLFFFKPTPFDVVMGEYIRFAPNDYYSSNPLESFEEEALSMDPDDFINSLDSLSALDNRLSIKLPLYRKWIVHHRSVPGNYYYIETLARKFYYGVLTYQAGANQLQPDYEKYLQKIVSSPYSPVKAHGVYQLSMLWHQQSQKYAPVPTFHPYSYGKTGYDTSFRFNARNALMLFEEHRALFDSFSYLKKYLELMEQKIKSVELNVSLQEQSLPGKPILAEIEFKNVDTLFYRIVHTPGIINSYRMPLTKAMLLSLKPISSQEILIPPANDYNRHATFLKIDSLQIGNYALLISHKPIDGDTLPVQHVRFNVTGLAIVSNHDRVFVLDRVTGLPVKGARIKNVYKDVSDDKPGKVITTGNYSTNEKGFAIIKDDRTTRLYVSYQGDSTYSYYSFDNEDEDDDEVYSKEEYDDLIEYYEENAAAEIFTDRSIYRPGQTVHYKVVFITRNPRTGERMVMNRANMKGSWIRKIYNKWLKESEPWLIINDPFNRDVDTIKVKLNDFGSTSGSYKLPKTAATGEWSIMTDFIDEGDNDGIFRVEEYKRPTYEIKLTNSSRILIPGDSFSVKVNVKSFAGARLANVQVKYMGTRTGRIPISKSSGNAIEYPVDTLLATSAYTNEEGELNIQITDSLLSTLSLPDSLEWRYTYHVSATALDATGEQYSENTSIHISSRPINIGIKVDKQMDRSAKNSMLLSTSGSLAGKVDRDVHLVVTREELKTPEGSDRKLIKPDTWLYTRQQLTAWFPALDFGFDALSVTSKVVLDTIIKTSDGGRFLLQPTVFTVGEYRASARVSEDGHLRGSVDVSFSVYDSRANEYSAAEQYFSHLPGNSFSPGDTLTYYSGSRQPVYAIYNVTYYDSKKRRRTDVFQMTQESPGINKWQWKIPANIGEKAVLSRVFVYNNQVVSIDENIYINTSRDAEPEIIIEKYRTKLEPGAKETFSVSIKTRNVNHVAELMTTMYDAALDKIEKHSWTIPRERNYRNIRERWDYRINYSVRNPLYGRHDLPIFRYDAGNVKPLWWYNRISSADEDVMADWSYSEGLDMDINKRLSPRDGYGVLSGRLAGVTIANTDGLSEVVVVGYATSVITKALQSSASLSRVVIRGSTSLAGHVQPLIVIDGVIYSGDVSKIDPATIVEAAVLKGADAVAHYGSRAANGVLVISTKGPIVFPKEIEQPLPPRKNFNELAFFYPAIHAGKDGYYSFTFTMPETVTEWNWKLMSHSKKAAFAYAERKLNTQLPLMVQPNMPRLLYQGDSIVLQSRITNLDTADNSGQLTCRIEDAVTGEDITQLLVKHATNRFSVNKKSNTTSAFTIKIPPQLENPVKVTIAARSQHFSDAEEHTIPILSKRVFVRDNLAFRITNDTTIHLPTLPNGSALYGVGLSITPRPETAILNGLAYLANYSFDCAEQVFNKMYAQVIAWKIMRTDAEAQKAFQKAKTAMEAQDSNTASLPDELASETMPWLRLSEKAIDSHKRLFELLDTSNKAQVISDHMSKLYDLQNEDGGMSWFKGGRSDTYISNYLMAGFERLEKLGLLLPQSEFTFRYKNFIRNLVRYCDDRFSKTEDAHLLRTNLEYTYGRSGWTDQFPITDSVKRVIHSFLQQAWSDVSTYNLQQQAKLIIATLRNQTVGPELQDRALDQLRSIMQLSIRDASGTRWKQVADSYDMTVAAEETMATVVEAFEEAKMEESLRKEVAHWLLNSKKENHWSSTKATAAVINMLLKEKNGMMMPTSELRAITSNNEIKVTDDLLSGPGFSFVKQTQVNEVAIKKQGASSVPGNVSWYYFTDPDHIPQTGAGVSLKKELYWYSDSTGQWHLVNSNTVLKLGAKLRVRIELETRGPLQYVYLDDKRAGAFEPMDTHSGYEYAGSVGYYQSIRDQGIQIFASSIPAGVTVFTYEMKVAHEGQFANGPASLQCMYNPAIATYSSGLVVKVIK